MRELRVQTTMRFAAFLVGAALFCGAEAQQVADWNNVLGAARKEGRVVLYLQSAPAIGVRLKDDFEKANPGLVLEIQRFAGLVTKLDQERQAAADGGDVLIAGELAWLTERAKEGALKPPAGPAAKAWPAQYLAAGGTAPLLSLEPFVIAYNSDAVKPAATSYQDLLRPELKGKIAVSELVGTPVIAWYDWIERTQGADFPAKLATQNPRITVGSVGATQSVASGELAMTAFSSPSVAMPLIEKGAPVKIVFPNPSLGLAQYGAVMGWSKRPNAAMVFLDYLMSARGQSVWNGKGESASPLSGIQGSLDVRTIQTYDPFRYTTEFNKAYREKWDRLFKK